MKTGFLFPGQGAQHVGMGSDIAGAFDVAAAVFAKADDILGFGLSKICFEGPVEKLNSTEISQPAIFTVSAAVLEVLRTRPGSAMIRPDVTAGLSLGEYTALYAAELVSFEDALRLTAKRGRAMQAASDASEGGMVGVIGLDEEKAIQLCDEARQGDILAAANFNCPGQVVVSGSKAACERVVELAEGFGAIKAVSLAVAGAFHTEMMAPAAQELEKALAETQIKDPGEIKTIANIDAEYYSSADEIRKGLISQLTQALYWQKCMEKLLAEGVETFYEIGPGRVLTGLMRRINRKTKPSPINSPETINALT